jgi:hypothetical protein
MKNRYQEGGPIDEMEEANNRPQIVSRRRPMMPMPSPNEESGKLQNMISSGSDIVGRPQDEGYRPNAGTASERAMLEGAYDSGKITESGNQGFGGPGTGRVVKPSKSAVVTKEELEKSGMSLREYMNKQQGLTRRKEKDPTAGDSPDKAAQEAADAIDPGRDMRTPRYTPPGSAPKQTTQKPKPKVFMPSKPDNSFSGSKFSKGGSVSSASSRADGCATKGKKRGKFV